MNSTTTQTLVERTAHSYGGSLYVLPSDEEERQRLVLQHQLHTRLLSGRLIFPPMHLTDKDEVLDIGTGAGAWLCEARAHLSEPIQLYGIDIESRLFPSDKAFSTNVHLSICSATDLPSYWTSKFALVNQRHLVCAYTGDQWLRAIEEMYRVLVPGGYAQLIEVGPEWVSGPKTASIVLFLDKFLGEKGMLFRCGVHIADMLKVAGFVDVTTEDVVMKLGKWAGEDGALARDVKTGALSGMRDSVMKAGGLGRFASVTEFEKAVGEIAEEWDSLEGSRTTIRVFCGRKPL